MMLNELNSTVGSCDLLLVHRTLIPQNASLELVGRTHTQWSTMTMFIFSAIQLDHLCSNSLPCSNQEEYTCCVCLEEPSDLHA